MTLTKAFFQTKVSKSQKKKQNQINKKNKMAADPSAKIFVCCLVIVLITSLTLTVYMPRFSCFYELHGIDNYTIEIYGAIFGCCFAFALISLILVLKWPHSTRVKYMTQLIVFIFIFGTSVFGTCAITILEVADEKMGASGNSTNDYNVFALRAASKFLSPDRELSDDWARVALANINNNNATDAEQTALCRLQKQFQCMMWESDRDTCYLPSTSTTTTNTSEEDFSLQQQETTSTNNASVVPSTVVPSSVVPSSVVPCLTCGIFTMNITEYNRPVSCMQAMVSCFVHGRHKYATSVESDPMDPDRYSYKADRWMLTAATVILFVISLLALWKNGFRDTGVVPARYGEYEHGTDYRSMKSELAFES